MSASAPAKGSGVGILPALCALAVVVLMSGAVHLKLPGIAMVVLILLLGPFGLILGYVVVAVVLGAPVVVSLGCFLNTATALKARGPSRGRLLLILGLYGAALALASLNAGLFLAYGSDIL